MHSGREVASDKMKFLGKIYVDFFALAQASVLIVNCPAESTFQLFAKLIRDANGLPTYRSTGCELLQPYPTSERGKPERRGRAFVVS